MKKRLIDNFADLMILFNDVCTFIICFLVICLITILLPIWGPFALFDWAIEHNNKRRKELRWQK